MAAGLQLPPVRHDEERDLDAIQGHTFSGTTSHMLTFLGDQTQASAAVIDSTCRMTLAEVRSRLVSLESQRFVVGRQNTRLVPPARLFLISSEERRRVSP